MKDNIYVSSLAFLNLDLKKIIDLCKINNFNLEFSSGMPYMKEAEELYLSADLNKLIHNYFPAPEVPFVLNLASTNEKIRKASINHCIKCLELTKKSKVKFYAAHAGFCVDPDPNELGKKISSNIPYDKKTNKEIFINSLNEILNIAERLEVDFLIENNVLSSLNFDDNKNFLLCVDSEEILWLFNNIKNDRFGLLLDTAHLKVSCETLNLNIEDEFKKIKPFVKAFHHSDNNGKQDSNQSITESYWFLKFINDFNDFPHVLEVKSLKVHEIVNQLKLLEGNEFR